MRYTNHCPWIIFRATVAQRRGFGDKHYRGKIVGVEHGDTLTLRRTVPTEWAYINRYELRKFRLAGVVCPQRGTRDPFSKQARYYTLDRYCGRNNINVYCPGNKIDAEGRLVGYVFKHARCLNHDIVRDGYAWWDWKNDICNAQMRRLESEAWYLQKGMWPSLNDVRYPLDWKTRVDIGLDLSGLWYLTPNQQQEIAERLLSTWRERLKPRL